MQENKLESKVRINKNTIFLDSNIFRFITNLI